MLFRSVLNTLPESITTVLIAMGYCGGSMDNICARQRLVIPNLDDCITMLLTKTDAQEGNLKQRGHMYFRDSECGGVNVQRMLDNLRQEYGMERGTGIFGMWFADYTHADIIDTGVFDCYEESYVESIQKQADSSKILPSKLKQRLNQVKELSNFLCQNHQHYN